MPDPITWGHVLMGLAALAALYGLVQLAAWARHRGAGNGPGTPGYARARDGRRYAIVSFALAALLLALGCLTPLCDMAVAGGAA
jgi:hypothetical protein